MKKLNNSNFVLLQDIIKDLKINYDENKYNNIEIIYKYWIETVGKKLSEFSKVLEYSDKQKLTIVCADCFIANEFYLKKDKLLNILNNKLLETGINIKDIKFDYKKWKQKEQ